MTTYKYRIYCITENTFVSGYGTNYPTTCYNNPAHTVNLNGVNLISNPNTINLPVSQQISFNAYTPLLDFNYIPINNLYSINLNVSGSSTLTSRIIDTTNNTNIATITNASTTDTPNNYNYTINTNNISSNPANWELQCLCSTGSAPIINNLQLIYYD
jgi:hypothetical protein